MINQSKKNDPRFWNRWKSSGAVESYRKFDYLIGICGEIPKLDESLSREEKTAIMKDYAKELYRKAKEKLQNYTGIEIINDELWLTYVLLARSPEAYIERLFGVRIRNNKMNRKPTIPDYLKGTIKDVKMQRKIVYDP